MTKLVRIENADTSNYKVLVEVWEEGATDADGAKAPDHCVNVVELGSPTQMAAEYIHSGRYLKVREG